MQNLPGADNGLTCQGKPLTNWWVLVGDFDRAMQSRMTLVERRFDCVTRDPPEIRWFRRIRTSWLDQSVRNSPPARWRLSPFGLAGAGSHCCDPHTTKMAQARTGGTSGVTTATYSVANLSSKLKSPVHQKNTEPKAFSGMGLR